MAAVANCCIRWCDCFFFRFHRDVVRNGHVFGRIGEFQGRVCGVFFLGLESWVYTVLLCRALGFFVGVAYFTLNIVFANIFRWFGVRRFTFGVGLVGENCVVEQRFNFIVIVEGNLLR